MTRRTGSPVSGCLMKLAAVFAQAIAAVEQGGVAVVDVRVEPGYTPAMTAAVSNAERKA